MHKNRRQELLDTEEVKIQYMNHERTRTLHTGRLGSVIAVIGIAIFIIQDTYVLGFHEFLAWRVMGITPFILFLLFSFTLFKKYPALIIPMHAVSLTGLISMMCGIIATLFMTSDCGGYNLHPASMGLIVDIFAIFIFAAGARKLLPAIIFIPLSVLLAMLFITCDTPFRNWAVLSNPVLVAFIVSIFSVHQSRLNFREFSSRKHAEINERLISIQHNSMSTMLNAMDESAFLMGPDGTIVYANDTLASRFGLPAGSIEGMNAIEMLPENIRQSRRDIAASCIESKKSARFVDERFGRSIDNIVYPVLDDYGNVVYLAILGVDITERIANEKEIKKLLDEKVLLLKEVHHRIKNNMLTISGLLTLRAESAENDESASILNEMSTRVMAMMRIYDRLYRSEEYSRIELHEYINELLAEISHTLLPGDSVSIVPDIEPMCVRQHFVFCVGIIINELVTNSLKYAFPGGMSGIINVRVKKNPENEIEIIISDNGIGMQSQKTLKTGCGFGLDLVKIMVQQCSGTVNISYAGGTTFTIILRDV